MPLHLLGKKSWNVYNKANIERVRRDEEDAQAKQEAQEQKQQQEDAAKRIGLLRDRHDGHAALPEHTDNADPAAHAHASGSRKRRRLHGEDDTDRDLRIAREDIQQGEESSKRLHRTKDDTALYDEDGHIQLLRQTGENDGRGLSQRPAMKASANDTFGEQLNANKPWYALSKDETRDQSTAVPTALDATPNKNVWGRQDDRRQDRERVRLNTNDPLAFMKTAQSQLKHSQAAKARWSAERQADLRDLKRGEDAQRKHRKHHREDHTPTHRKFREERGEHVGKRERGNHDEHREQKKHKEHSEPHNRY